MKAFFWFLCYPCTFCCSCPKSATTKTKASDKTDKTVKTGGTPKIEDRRQTTPKDTNFKKSQTQRSKVKTAKTLIKGMKTKKKTKAFDQSLTKEFQIPEDFKTREEFLISQSLTLGEELGTGGYATVYKMTDSKTQTVMACKMIKLFRNESQFESVKSEINIMVNANPNPNIIRVLNHFILRDNNNMTEFCYILMEFANGGSILDRMKTIGDNNKPKHKRLSESKAKDYFSQTVNGLDYLHSVLETAHKDLKLLNILVIIQSDNKEVVKITDFGLSRISYDPKIGVIKNKTWVGTVDYMSPQIFRIWIYDQYSIKVDKLKEYNPFAADCWALGVCLYVMITASLPFPSCGGRTPGLPENEIRKIYENMRQQNYEITQNTRLTYSTDCLDLISELLEPVPYSRLTIKQVKTHRWLKISTNP